MLKLSQVFNLEKTEGKGHTLSVSAKKCDYLQIVQTLSAQAIAVKSANIDPDLFLQSTLWYDKARLFASTVAERYDVPFAKVCGAIAALSPQNKWEQNMVDTVNLIRHFVYPVKYGMPKVSTFNANRDKAMRILNTCLDDITDVCKVLKAPKTSSFARNIYGDTEAVTVDLWALRGALMLPANTNVSCTATAYKVVEQAYRDVAHSLGASPSSLQSTLWVVLKGLTEGTIQA